MTDFASLEIRIKAVGVDDTKRAVQSLGGEIDSTASKTSKGAEQMNKGFMNTEAAARKVQTAVMGILTAATVSKIAQWSDAWTEAGNGLRRFTTSANDLKALQADLLGVANSTRASVDSTAALFSKLSMATEEMRLSRDDLIDITTTINQSFQLGGASAAEAAGSIRQLGQALASGVLRGDEFNSIAEQAPGIMRAIAKETNLSIGELRDFAAEGKITADIVVRAIQNSSEEINRLFQETERTFSSFAVEATNNLKAFVGESDGVAFAIRAVGGSMVALSENAGAVSAAVTAAGAAFSLRFIPVLAGLSGPIGLASVAIGGLYVAIRELAEYMASDDIRNMSVDSILGVDGLGIDQIDAEINSVLARLTGLASTIEDLSSGRNGKKYLLSELYQQHMDEAEQMAVQLDNLADARQRFTQEMESVVEAASNSHAFSVEFDLTLPEEKKEQAIITVEEAIAELQEYMDASPHKFSVEFDMTIPTEGWVEGKDADFPLNDPRFKAAQEQAEKAAQAIKEHSEEIDRAFNNMMENVQRAWGDFIYDMLSEGELNFESFFDTVKKMFLRLVADMAAADLMNAVFGVGQGGNLAGLFGNIAGLIGKIGSGGAGENLVIDAATGAISTATTAAGAGAGIWSSITGAAGTAWSTITSGLGTAGNAIMGLLSNPLTWGIAALGMGFANDWWSDPDGYKRSNVGMLVNDTPGADPSRTFSVDPFASGFTPTGFVRRGSRADADALINQFRAIDAMAVDYIGKLGGTINMSGIGLHGIGEDGVLGTAGTFMGVGGKSQAGDIDQQFLSFGKQIIANAGGLDPELIARVQAAGSAEEVKSILDSAVAAKAASATATGDVTMDSVTGEIISSAGAQSIVDAIISFRDPVLGWLTAFTNAAANGEISWYTPKEIVSNSPLTDHPLWAAYQADMQELAILRSKMSGSSAIAHMGSMAQNIKRFTEILDRWEIDGQPPVRT